MVTDNFSIHAEGVGTDLESGIVTVRGFDLGELLSQFPAEEVLRELEFSDVADYYIEASKDDE